MNFLIMKTRYNKYIYLSLYLLLALLLSLINTYDSSSLNYQLESIFLIPIQLGYNDNTQVQVLNPST